MVFNLSKRASPMKNKYSEKTTKTTFYLPEDLHAELKIQAVKLRTSMTKIIIQALQRELERMTNKSLDKN